MTPDRLWDVVRRVGPGVGLVVLAASLVVAVDLFGARQALFGSATPPPRPAAFSRVESSPAPEAKTVLRSVAWWQAVERFRGTGPTSLPAVAIRDDAIQWRLGWSCRRGRFVVRRPGSAAPLVDAACAEDQENEFTQRFDGGLQIQTEGPWTAKVEQQVDVPLVEPPLPAMSSPGTRKVATGAFYRMDQVGRGRVTIYRLANGRLALRLHNFYVTPNIELEIRLSPLRAPRTTRQYLRAPAKLAAPLDITAGSMNFVLAEGIDLDRYRSVVIWCPLITSAYAAATLH